MRNWMKAAIIAAGTSLAASAHADPPNLSGSDTLEALTKNLITTNCGNASNANLAALLTYVGGGSGTASNAMLDNLRVGGPTKQQVAGPMSRAINSTECNNVAITDKTKVQGLVFALDGIVVVSDTQNTKNCGGGNSGHPDDETPGPPFSKLPINATAWKNKLKLAFLGIDDVGAVNCKSPARQALAGDFKSMFEGGCTSTGCTSIAHFFRRGDTSGTTDTFLSLIGAPSITRDANNNVIATPFCNGLDSEDNDPIRRSCDQTEQVCEANGTLGLVLPIRLPTATNDLSSLYNADVSPPFSKFKASLGTACIDPPPPVTDPSGTLASPCAGTVYNLPTGCSFPNSPRCDCRFPTPQDFANATKADGTSCGLPSNPAFYWNTRAGGCPVSGDGLGRWGVVNGDDGTRDNSPAHWGTRALKDVPATPPDRTPLPTLSRCCNRKCPAGGTQFFRMDARVMNLAWRVPTGTGSVPGRIQDFDDAGKNGTNATFIPAFYRIHANELGLTDIGQIGDVVQNCQLADATLQIACLVQHTSTCSYGYAGLEAADNAVVGAVTAEPFSVGGIDPTKKFIQKLITDPANAYPLSRRLYYNTLIGFGTSPLVNPNGSATNYQNAQFNLYKCMADVTSVQDGLPAVISAIDLAGFIEVPGGPKMCNNMCNGNNACTTLSAVPANDLLPAFAY